MKNEEGWKHVFENKNAIHFNPFHTGDDHSADKFIPSVSGGPSFLKHSCDSAHTLVNIPNHKSSMKFGTSLKRSTEYRGSRRGMKALEVTREERLEVKPARAQSRRKRSLPGPGSKTN